MYHDEIMTLKLANPGAPNRPNLGTLRSLEAEMKEYDPPGNHGFFFTTNWLRLVVDLPL